MGTTADKLNHLIGTRAAIEAAIEAKGVTVPEGATFRSLASLIESIPTGGGYDMAIGEVSFNSTKQSFSVVFDEAMHNAPDIIVICRTSGRVSNTFGAVIGVSADMGTIAGSDYRQVAVCARTMTPSYVIYDFSAITATNGFIRSATASGFTYSGSSQYYYANGTYIYIAISLA